MAIIIEDIGDAPATIDTPYSMEPGDQFYGFVDNAYGQDWVAIDLLAGQQVTITMVGSAEEFTPAIRDPYLYLFNSDELTVRGNDDGGPGLTSRLTYTASQAGTYYVGAAGYSQNTGAYLLEMTSPVTLTAGDDYFEATPDIGPVNALAGNDTLIGSDDSDKLRGQAGDDSIEGNGGDDTLAGFNGDDTLLGGDGDDALYAGRGDDRLEGGAGDDRLIAFGDYYLDPSQSINTLLGGDGDDTINVSNGVNWIEGGDGDDYIYASGTGSAVIFGGDGADNILGYTHDMIIYGGDGDDFIEVQNTANLVYGDAGNDTIRGFWGNHTLSGGDGNDLIATSGEGLARGGNGNDTLRGGWGNQTFVGGAGADEIYGRQGRDTADYSYSAQGAGVDLLDQDLNAGAAAGDQLFSIEVLQGSAFDDTLGGNDFGNSLFGWVGDDALSGRGGNDYLDGWLGDDTLDGGAGNDTLVGGAGADEISGGEGIDVVLYIDATEGMVLDLLDASMNAGAALGDVVTGVENVLGTDLADTISGDAADNRLDGNAGNDSLTGMSGDDTLRGEFGNDTLTGGEGADRLIGGLGRDVASYAGATDGVTVDLEDATLNTGDAMGDILVSIEALRATAMDDILAGNTYANTLAGFAGDDQLYGRGGADRLFGGLGEDTLSGGTGNDILTGGDGADMFVFETDGGADVITDFDVMSDTLAFYDVSVTDVSQVGTDTVVSYDIGGTVTLENLLTTQADLMMVFAASDMVA